MARFRSFVILGAMRFGTNYLEKNLGQFEEIACYGEAFNPGFVGWEERPEQFGFDVDRRDRDPLGLLQAIRSAPAKINGFRYFPDHDRRIFDAIVDDESWGKIVVHRNPVRSFVSLQIARATGQWRVMDGTKQIKHQVQFDPDEFDRYYSQLRAYQGLIHRRLQLSGQSAFFASYDDAIDLDVINGMAAWLGAGQKLERPTRRLKKQNVVPLHECVGNFDEMCAALQRYDRFDLFSAPNFEPEHWRPTSAQFVSESANLVFLPLLGSPDLEIREWLAKFPSGGAVHSGMKPAELKAWKLEHEGHRTFTVLRHPVLRVLETFSQLVLTGEAGFAGEHFDRLIRTQGLALAEAQKRDPQEIRGAFERYLAFCKVNVQGRSRLPAFGELASQAAQIEGFGDFVLPDRIIREGDLASELPQLAQEAGRVNPPPFASPDSFFREALAKIYDAGIEGLVRDAYERDYATFGFADWDPEAVARSI